MVHRVLRTGSFEHKVATKDGMGKIVESTKLGNLAELQGMLGFIDSIDRNFGSGTEKSEGTKGKKLSAYAHFLLFRNFYAAETPVIVTEGKTDLVYLTHAMRQLAPSFPILAATNSDGSIKLLARLFKYAGKNTGKTIGLVGGAGDLSKFIRTYKSAIATYKAPSMTQPVILVVDNDEGGKGVRKTAEIVSKSKFTGQESFVHVVGNLYLVWTPLLLKATSSCIEDGFDQKTKFIEVAGKTFNPDADTDTDINYGKAVFAYKVVEAHSNKINFEGFAPLLTRIARAINYHATTKVA